MIFEILTRAVLFISLVAFLSGMLITAVSGSARPVKIYLLVLTGLAIIAIFIGMIATHSFLIFLLPQIISLVLIIFFIIVAGAAAGGGIYAHIHKKPSANRLSESEINDYLPVAEFARIEGITEERALSRINNGFYQGGLYNNAWYVHQSELS